MNKHYVTENLALIGIGIDQLQLSELTRRMIMRPAAESTGTKAKALPDSVDVPNKFHPGMLYCTVVV